MKRALGFILMFFISAGSNAEVVVQVNGQDGSFLWQSVGSSCWQAWQTFLDISQPITQSNLTRTPYTLEWQRACFFGMGCEPTTISYLSGGSSAVEIAGGGSVQYHNQCDPNTYTIPTPQPIYYNETIDANRAWSPNRVPIELVFWFPSDITGRFVGIRLYKPDGWHYGWVVLYDSTGRGLPGTLYGDLRPAAYAIETNPNTPVTTPPCSADLNFDGSADIDDYLLFLDYFTSGDERARWSHFSYEDPTIDFFDYLDFLNDFVSCAR